MVLSSVEVCMDSADWTQYMYSSHFDQSLPGASNPMYYGGNNMSLPFTRVQQERPALANCNTSNFLGISCGTQASLEPQTSNLSPNSSTLSSLSNTLNSLKSGYPGLDFSNSSRDWNSFFEPHHQISRALPSMRDNFALFGMPVDGFDHNNVNDPGLQWRLQEQKLAPTFENGQVEDGQGSEGRAFLPFEDHTVEKSEVITSLPPSIKVEDENRLPSEWKVEAESLFAETAGDSTSYWNGGAWPDLSSYGSSVSPLI